MAQWSDHSELNGHIEGSLHRALAGQGVRPPTEVRRYSPEAQCQPALPGQLCTQFVSGSYAGHDVRWKPQLRDASPVLGGLRAAGGTMGLEHAGLHPVMDVHPALTSRVDDGQLLQSGVALPSGSSKCWTPRESPSEARARLNPTRGRVEFEHVAFSAIRRIH